MHTFPLFHYLRQHLPGRGAGMSLLLLLLPLLGWGQPIATFDFESPAGIPPVAGGTTYSGNSASADRPANVGFAVAGTGYGVSNTSATITSSAIDASEYNSISVSFRLASFSINSTGNGADAADIVRLAISTDGTNFVEQVNVAGPTASNAYWYYSATGVATRAYATTSATPFAPAATGSRTTDGYSTVSVTGISTTSTLRFRISMVNNAAGERWIIDNIVVAGTLTVPAAVPTVTTTALPSVTTTTADVAGNITSLGSPKASSSYGFLYSTSASTAAALVVGGAGVTAAQVGTTGATTGSYTTTLSSLTPGTTYYFRAYAINGTGTGYGDVESFITASPTSPTITTGSLIAFNTLAGQPSAEQTINVGGTNLTAGITITPPAGYEVSINGGTSYSASAQTLGAAGTVASTAVLVRLTGATATGSLGTSLLIRSAGATNQDQTVSGTVVAEPTTAPSVAAGIPATTTVTLTLSGGTGTRYLVVVRPAATVAVAPTDGTTYTANAAYGAVGATATTGPNNYVVLAATTATTTVNVTGLTASTAYAADVYAYNEGTANGFENYLPTAGTTSFTTDATPVTPVSLLAFDFNGTDNVATVSSSYNDPNVSASTFSRMGVNSNAGGNRFNSNNWSTTISASKYITFTFNPASGYQANLTTLSFTDQRSGSGANPYEVRSSLDNYAAPIASGTTSGGAKTINLTGFSAIQASGVTFRFYYAVGSAGSTYSVDDVQVSGTISVSTMPVISVVSPNAATAGGGDFTITVTGTNFTAGSVVKFNGVALTTDASAAASGTLTATVPASAITTPDSYLVTVTTASGTSNALSVTVGGIYYSKASGDLNVLSTFGANPDGSGAAPTSFTTNNTVFNVTGTGRSIGASWTVAGTGSKVVLGSNASFTVPAAVNFTGLLDLGAGATLAQLNATPAVTFGSIDVSSTVEYAQSGNYTLAAFPAAGYGNLTLRNATKTLPNGTGHAVRGNLIIDNVTDFGGGTSTFTTLSLGGNLTLNGTVTFDAPGKITLLATNVTGQQIFQGNGNTLQLFRLTTTAAAPGIVPPPGVVLSGNTTPLEVGNIAGGGYDLGANTMLYVNNNTLSFFAGGRAAIGSGTGMVTATSGANFVFNRGAVNPGSLGTLRLPAAATTNINNFTLNTGGLSATAFDSLAVSGTLLVGGTTTLSRGHLFINANSTVTFGGDFSIANSASSRLGGLIGGTTTSGLVLLGSGAVDTLAFAHGVAQLGSLTVNRTDVPTIPVATDVRVNTLLTLTSGRLEMLAAPATAELPDNTYRVYLDASGAISGGGLNNYINALTQGAATNNITTSRTLAYPLGKGGQYRPLTLEVEQGVGTTYYTARQFEKAPAARALSTATLTATEPPVSTTPLTRVSQIRYFNVRPEVTAGAATLTSARITLTYDPANDRANNDDSLRIAKSSSPGSAWESIGGTGNGINITSGAFTSFSDFALATVARLTSNNPLPVELVRFVAERSPAAVTLTWTTASEKNSAYFEVQRRGDGFADTFGTIARVEAQGSSSTPRSYSALDENLSDGTVYYRLRQVDRDGTAHYSSVVAVAPQTTSSAAPLSFYPNPATDVVTVTKASLSGQSVRILDLTGREVRRTLVDAAGQVSLRELAAGTYLLQVQDGTRLVTRRISKQ